MDYDLYRKTLEYEEGFREEPYLDTAGKWTVGYGFNLTDNGMPRKVADHWLQIEVEKREDDLRSLFGDFRWASMMPARRAALISMHYQLGAGGFRQFKKMIQCVMSGDWTGASQQCLDSKAGKNPKLRGRFRRNAYALETGKIPEEWGMTS